jgi:hypothetical protein
MSVWSGCDSLLKDDDDGDDIGVLDSDVKMLALMMMLMILIIL